MTENTGIRKAIFVKAGWYVAYSGSIAKLVKVKDDQESGGLIRARAIYDGDFLVYSHCLVPIDDSVAALVVALEDVRFQINEGKQRSYEQLVSIERSIAKGLADFYGSASC